MTQPVAQAFLLVFVVFLAGCGYVGDPLPPLANIPAKVEDLAAVQRGARIIVQFTIPEMTTEGIAIKTPPRVDLRIGTAADPTAWAAQARKIPEGRLPYSIPSEDWTGQEVAIAVNVIGANGKESGWSNLVNLPIVAPPPQPASVRADPTHEGVRLTWQGPPGEFRVFRSSREEKNFAPVATVSENTWTDHSSEFGKPYLYLVQRIVKLDDRRQAESEPSEEVAITPRDLFPPTVPTGLRANASIDSIELSWERSPESDLAGYRIYRSVADGAFEKIADTGQIPAFSDRAVERGKQYRYAVTSIDQAGNESTKSAVAEATIV